MGGKGADLSTRTKLSQARPQNDGEGHGAEPAHSMYYGGTRKVDIAVAEIHGRSQLREPATAPGPAAGNRIQDRADEKFTQKKRPKADAFANGADDNVSGSLHEHDFKQRQAIAAAVVSRAQEKKTLPANESPLTAS